MVTLPMLLVLVLAGVLMNLADNVAVSRSNKARNTQPQVTPAQRAQFVADNTAFALALYRQLRPAERNLVFSPYSISTALAMTYAGARGETEQQMARTLHFSLPQAQLHPAFNALDLSLSATAKDAKGQPLSDFQLTIANALWGQQGYQFQPQFLDLLAQNYGAGMNLVDYTKQTEAARKAINTWVSDKTQGKIVDLLQPGLLDRDSRLVLTNAIYFKNKWRAPFEKHNSKPDSFTLLDGTRAKVQMMSQQGRFNYFQGAGFQALELPYRAGDCAMLILLPESGRFADFEKSLTAAQLNAITRQLTDASVAVDLPKYKFEAPIDLTETLQQLGMTTAFSSSADFSGMTGSRELYISAVIHKAMVAVDEEGTEAAAATAVVMRALMAPATGPRPISFRADRPFFFLIRDTKTGALLFLGRVLNPAT